MSHLNGSTPNLLKGEQPPYHPAARVAAFPQPVTMLQPVAPPQEPQALIAEVESLPCEQVLVNTAEYAVFFARSWQMPHLMNEIGRLREITFRSLGEGTGKACDVDQFDSYYDHLFLWNRDKKEIAGAYRLGRVDEILKLFGKKGLYTNTLFRFKKSFFKDLGVALELGRSFVRIEYQRTPSALFLLWKGIGQFILRHPRYKMLFGPVSISNRYQSISQQLIVEFLFEQNFAPELARYVKPRSPFRGDLSKPRGLQINSFFKSVEDVSAFISNIEDDKKGVPVLLRQYLKLGARVVGFNVDAAFYNSLDALIVVDLTNPASRILGRFVGETRSLSLLSGHCSNNSRNQAFAQNSIS